MDGSFACAIYGEQGDEDRSVLAPGAMGVECGGSANEARHRYLHGSLEATPSAVTFTRGGKSQSIGWDEVESVAYSEDPMTQEREWWLRGGGRPDRLRSIRDADADRSRLLGYFALYLPGFDPSVFERQVLGALRENPEAVVECWKRT